MRRAWLRGSVPSVRARWGVSFTCLLLSCAGEKQAEAPTGPEGSASSSEAATATTNGAVSSGPSTSGTAETVEPAANAVACGPGNVGTNEPAFCGAYQAVTIPNDPNLVVASDAPNEPLVAGQPYVVSVEVFTNRPTIEFWGANAQCGDGLELLASVESAEGVHCLTLNPSASYSRLLTVLRGSEANGALVTRSFCGAAGYCDE